MGNGKKEMVDVVLLTDRRLKGLTLPRERGVAEYLVSTGQARYPDVETRPLPAGETPENPDVDNQGGDGEGNGEDWYTEAELEAMSREDLLELAGSFELEVQRTDGREDLDVRKSDLIAAILEHGDFEEE